MFTISHEQMETLQTAEWERFRQRLARHLQEQYPDKLLGDPESRTVANACVDLARARGLTLELDICQYAHLLLVFGRNFETRTDIAWAEPIAPLPGEAAGAWVARVTRIALATPRREGHA